MEEILLNQQLLSGKTPPFLNVLYLCVLCLVFAGVAATFFVSLDVTVKAKGILRPAREMTTLRVRTGGVIDSIFVSDGHVVNKGDKIMIMKDQYYGTVVKNIELEKNNYQILLKDLEHLVNQAIPNKTVLSQLSTKLYREQFKRFSHEYEEMEVQLRHARKELSTATALLNDRIIAQVEFGDIESSYMQMVNRSQGFWHEQLSKWNLEKQQLQEALNSLDKQQIQYIAEQESLAVIAPVSGVIMGIHERYTGAYLQASEVICSISPQDSLVAECYVGSAEIGFLKNKQPVIFKVDAFDYKQFGTLNGQIDFIDPDITSTDKDPVFKIRCSINNKPLSLKNHYLANIKKGMTIQGSVIITRRTIWQLFFDKFHNWFQPEATV